MTDWTTRLLWQLTFHWENHVRPKLDGLTDEEYFWEPVEGCWSLRPGPNGVLVVDFAFPAPDPPPVTTIAWRLGHLSVGVFGMRNASHFGGPPMSYDDVTWPATAAAALDLLDDGYARWVDGVRGLDAGALERSVGEAEGPWASLPYADLVLHISREAIHHGAEVLLLRDLYRSR